MKLVPKIGLAVITIGCIAIIITSVMTYEITARALEHVVSEKQMVLTRETMDKIDRFLYERSQDVRHIAQSGLAEKALVNTNTEETKDARHRLYEVSALYKDLYSVEIINTTGTSVFFAGSHDVDTSVEASVYHNALEQALHGVSYYSDIVHSTATGESFLFFATPVKSGSLSMNRIVGAVVARISSKGLDRILQYVWISSAHLYTHEGVLIATKGARQSSLPAGQVAALRQLMLRDNGVGSVTASLPATVLGFSGGSSKEILRALISYASEQGYEDYKPHNWFLVLETPTHATFAASRHVALNVAFLVFGGLFLLIFLIIVTIHKALKPIGLLTASAHALADGHMNQRVQIKSHDEFAFLATTFNVMAKRIQESFERLKAEREYDATLLASIGDGVFVIDQKQHITLFNKAAEDLCGYTAQEVLGSDYQKIFKFQKEDTHFTDHSKLIEQALDKRKIYSLREPTELVCKDGNIVSVHATAAPVYDTHGEFYGVVVVMRDVSRERAFEQSKDEFLSIASHQLRTPLGSMRWRIEMLLGDELGKMPSVAKVELRHMYENTTRMIGLVRDLLTIARIQQGRINDTPSAFSVQEIIGEVLEELKAEAKHREVVVRMRAVRERMPKAWADPHKFREALQNLLFNAISYNTPKGLVEVSVTQKDKYLEVRVRDTGVGIPSDDQKSIGLKFFRGSNVQTIETEGTGFGLFVVQSYVHSWGGKMHFKSHLGKGSIFYITVPLAS